MTVAELIELLKTMPQDAEVATTTMPGIGMFAGIHGAVQYTPNDGFGEFKMVILENGTYPTILPD